MTCEVYLSTPVGDSGSLSKGKGEQEGRKREVSGSPLSSSSGCSLSLQTVGSL